MSNQWSRAMAMSNDEACFLSTIYPKCWVEEATTGTIYLQFLTQHLSEHLEARNDNTHALSIKAIEVRLMPFKPT